MLTVEQRLNKNKLRYNLKLPIIVKTPTVPVVTDRYVLSNVGIRQSVNKHPHMKIIIAHAWLLQANESFVAPM